MGSVAKASNLQARGCQIDYQFEQSFSVLYFFAYFIKWKDLLNLRNNL
jgi:hypothetical protein